MSSALSCWRLKLKEIVTRVEGSLQGDRLGLIHWVSHRSRHLRLRLLLHLLVNLPLSLGLLLWLRLPGKLLSLSLIIGLHPEEGVCALERVGLFPKVTSAVVCFWNGWKVEFWARDC